MLSSSSTRWMTRLSPMFLLRPRMDQGKMKAGAAAVGALHPDTAAMRFDDGPADREAEAHAVGLCRVERREELLADSVRDAGTGILHGHLDQPVRAQPGRHLEVANRTLRHRLDCIAHQVEIGRAHF